MLAARLSSVVAVAAPVRPYVRQFATRRPPPRAGVGASDQTEANRTLAMYGAAVVVVAIGASYGAVPLYQMFCQATGYGGTVQKVDDDDFKSVRPVEGAKPVTVHFSANTADTMPWRFTPLQRTIRVKPGEHALAFYRATNPTNKPITGVSTYNITPMRAGIYFKKVQCFCFEEQRLGPGEEIDMPLFFYIDPEFCDDPAMRGIRTLTLSYTFFRTNSPAEDTAAPAVVKE